MRGPLALVVTLALCLALPQTAAAWTDATVRTARAEIELTPDGRAHVTMWARVRVDGGWLEGLELEGLDADAILDPERPLVFRDAAGVALPVQVTPREDGRVSLRFTRRMAPRRGEYDIELAWTTALATSRAREDGDLLEARWVFPAWHYGLDGVEIRWIVPAAAVPQPDAEITAPIETERGPVPERDGVVAITYRRAHLPRTSDWETLVLVPASDWPHVIEAAASDASDAAAPSAEDAAILAEGAVAPSTVAPTEGSSRDADGTSSALALLLAFGAWLKRRDLEHRARRVRREARFLVPAPRWVATLASVSLAATALAALAVALDVVFLVGLAGLVVALGWQRGVQGSARPKLAALAPVPTRELQRARRESVLDWIGPAAWLEPTRLGALTALLAGASTLDQDGPSRAMASLLLALVASGSRTRLGATPAPALRALARAMEALRVEATAPFVSVRLLGRGASDPTEPRIHVSLAHDGAPPLALENLRTEIVTEERAPGSLLLSVSAREGTPSEQALIAWAAEEGLAITELGRRPTARCALEGTNAGPMLARVIRGVLAHGPRDEETTLLDEAAE